MLSLRHLLVLSLVVAALAIPDQIRAEYILNGGFESNTAVSTQFNLNNTTYNAFVANSTGFSTAQEIDLVTSTDFGIPPFGGNWKVGLHTQGVGGLLDALSLQLSGPLTTGNTYTLSLYSALLNTVPGDFQIGLSTTDNSFGTLIFSGTAASSQAWTQSLSNFVAPNNGGYLTLRSAPGSENYVFFDNVSLVDAAAEVPEPASIALWSLMSVAGLAALRRRQRANVA